MAKSAAMVAGLALVAFSVFPSAPAHAQTSTSDLQAQIASLLAQIASLQAQLGVSQGVTATFSRNLTVGSSGADVTQLQTWLISKGFNIPAGATGYFGSQTKAAVAAYQAANSIVPAAGYFGPITRSNVNAIIGAGTGTGTGTGGGTGSSDTLTGGEASLRTFDLVAGDDLSEGDSNTEIALAKFDVRNGDVRVQRVTVEVTGQSGSASVSKLPWKFIDTLSVYNGSRKVGDIDAGSKSDWDKSGNTYSIDIPVDSIVRQGNTAELSIRADAQSTIDSTDEAQTFLVSVPDNGIRAVDARGIQQYTGDDADQVTLAFNSAQSGDLTLRTSSDNPDSGILVSDPSDTSDRFDVLKFEIRNRDAADVDLNTITIRVATSTTGTANNITNIIRRATLDIDGDTFSGTVKNDNTIVFDDMNATINGDDTVNATLSVELFGQSGRYAASGESLTFSLANADVDAEGSDTGDQSDVGGSVNGNVFSISSDAGINATGTSNNAVLTYNSNDTTKSYGTYTLKFTVTASGNDVFIPKTATLDSASSTYAGVHFVNTGTAFTGTETVSLSTTADSQNSTYYVIHDGDSETFTGTVTLDPTTTGTYQIGVDFIQFSSTDANLNSLGKLDLDQNDSKFHTDPLYIPN